MDNLEIAKEHLKAAARHWESFQKNPSAKALNLAKERERAATVYAAVALAEAAVRQAAALERIEETLHRLAPPAR